MPLIQLWETSPDIVLGYNIKQVIALAGDGILTDNTECSKELRHYLRNVPSEKLFEHAKFCLASPLEKGGNILQDIVNELGRRLDYDVEDGLYQGRSNRIGYDGLWKDKNGHTIIIEIKTTDAYRINLDTIASYRDKLIKEGKTGDLSMLIVVGRNDTGDLESQVRGSRHAWDVRIISIEALNKLVELKVKSGEDETVDKIRSLLIPFDYTRLDNIIDVMFTTAKDVETDEEQVIEEVDEGPVQTGRTGIVQNHTPQEIMDSVRKKSLDALSKKLWTPLIQYKRAQFWNSDKTVRAMCPGSKKYDKGNYWYALHPQQKEFLDQGKSSYLLLSCLDHPYAYAIPNDVINNVLPKLTITQKSNGKIYWHIRLWPSESGYMYMAVPKKEKLDLTPYAVQIA